MLKISTALIETGKNLQTFANLLTVIIFFKGFVINGLIIYLYSGIYSLITLYLIGFGFIIFGEEFKLLETRD